MTAPRDNQNPLFGTRKPATPAPVFPKPKPKPEKQAEPVQSVRSYSSAKSFFSDYKEPLRIIGIGCIGLSIISIVSGLMFNEQTIVFPISIPLAMVLILYQASFMKICKRRSFANKKQKNIAMWAMLAPVFLLVGAVVFSSVSSIKVENAERKIEKTETTTKYTSIVKKFCPNQAAAFAKTNQGQSILKVQEAMNEVLLKCNPTK